jgi:excisionase family DNA binding protein
MQTGETTQDLTTTMTKGAAASRLNISVRTLERMIEDGYLEVSRPIALEGERGPVLIFAWQVEELRAARIRTGQQKE